MKKKSGDSHPEPVQGIAINLSGSGPDPIIRRDSDDAAVTRVVEFPVRLRLVASADNAIAVSLASYIAEFGQGKASARCRDGSWWLDIPFRQDAAMIANQFGHLLAEMPQEGC